jgi:uncharacterized protein YecT (DUF1311 family)
MTPNRLAVCASNERSAFSMKGPARAVAVAALVCAFAGWNAASASSLQVAGPDGETNQDESAIHLRQAYADCIGGGAMTTAAVLQCAHDEFEFQDKRLNRAYKALMSSVPADQKIALRNEERQWLASKKIKCALPEDAGTTDQVSSADCEVTETARRATFLEGQIHK